MQFHKKFQPKHLAFTELGFPLREKIGQCDWFSESFHEPVKRTAINFADDKSFALLGTGKTRGVFQVESPGMIDTLIKLRPSNLEEVIAVIALYRPGPMELIDSFIKRKKD